jgi:hypothetical protein
MRKERTVRKLPAKISRIVLKTIAFLLLFVVFVFVLLLTPPVQRFLTARVQHYLENKLHTKVLIGRISFGLSGKIGLNNVFIADKTNDTLVSGGSIKAHLNYLKLFSNEVRVKDLEVNDMTAKIKRVLPDTVYNFQFILDAFTSENTKSPDTASSPPMKLDIAEVSLKNINLTYTDAVAGSDMFAHIGELAARIDTLDPYTQHFVVPSLVLRNSNARMKQVKPIVEPKPLEQHVSEAATRSSMNLQLGSIVLEKVKIDYGNDVSALYAIADIGRLETKQKSLDLPNNKVDLENFTLNDSKLLARLGKTKQAQIVKQEAKKEAIAQQQAGWRFLVSNVNLNNNTIQFDDDNKPALKQGIDYSHIAADDLTLEADNLVMTPDSIAVSVKKGSVKEKSGLTLDQFSGDIVYASHQSYVRNLYIKTPGSELKRALVVNYPSLDALTKHPEQVSFQVDIAQTKLQVRDILLFVPGLRSNPALRNPNDVWNVNLVGSGTMDHFNFETLQFAGLSSTQINAHGSLSGLTNPKNAGGNFVIERFHTNQNDIALFTGSKLSNEQINLPHDLTIRGTIKGNAGTINTNMRVLTPDGNVSVNGTFSNLTNPAKTKYNGQITTTDLQVGKILRQENTIGPLSATIVANGQGLTPNSINTKFSAVIASASYNQYPYKNISLSGSLQKTNFDVHTTIKDPNADADIMVTGNFSDHPAFIIHGMIDSIKTQPLHLTTEPLIVRGRIDGSASDLAADNVNANILITQALFVSRSNRLALDTVQLESGKNDTANYIRLNSSIAKANIVGHYRLADLGSIMQNSIKPYFNTGAAKLATVQPYHFTFTLDVIYDPVFAAFVPGLTEMHPLHASGSFSNAGGMNMELTTSSVVYQGNTISDVKFAAKTTSNGLEISGGIAHLKSSSFDLYNSRVNAIALNNNINFSVGTDDAKGKNKYFIAGLFSQPTANTYSIQLKPDSLLLNYQPWSVTANNRITISPDDIIASNFILQNGDQRLSINSPDSRGKQLLLVELSNFRLATITGFANVDSLLADGLINGNVRLSNFLQQPSFTGDLAINDLSIQKDTVGNVKIRASSGGANRYNIESTITGHGNDVSLAGWIATEANDTKLNLDLDVKTLQLKSVEPFTAGALRNTSGTLNGRIAIRGSVNEPALNGDLNFNKSSFALSMLGSQFYVDDQKISVTNDGISFSKFTVKDSSGNALALDGNIITNNFINYEYNLKLTARNFQLLNSTKKDNPIYYGRMIINTDLSISGTEVSPAVDGRITVDNGTSLTFVVPQGNESAESREGIVEFVDMSNPANDSLFKKYDSLNAAGILGMDIALNIEIKKEAVFNIIVDAANGDFLNAQGEAQLTAGIDPSGKVTLTGNYTLEKGSYQLSFNLLQRKFEISKGSSITWTGEPTTAQLDVTAVYIANTPPIDLVQDQIASSSAAIKNTYMQKLPFQVHLKLTGELMKPLVAFDIILPQDKNYGVSNDVVTTVEYKLAQLRADEGETNKQVFSLLLLNRFVGENPFASEGGGGGFSAETYVRQSASKLLTQQLNQLAAGLINGVDINFDVVSTEDYTTGSMRNKTDLNVNVSKRLLNDRLKISVGSEFGLEGPQTTNQQGNNIAGNLSAEYQLSRDGRYLLRFFEKNDYEGELYGYVVETGLSFVITVDYNRFKEIFRKRKQRVESTDQQKVTTK